MTRTTISRFGRTALVAMAGIAVAGTLVLATTMTASAAGPAHCPNDWNENGVGDGEDVFLATAAFGTGEASGTDIFAAISQFGVFCQEPVAAAQEQEIVEWRTLGGPIRVNEPHLVALHLSRMPARALSPSSPHTPKRASARSSPPRGFRAPARPSPPRPMCSSSTCRNPARGRSPCTPTTRSRPRWR